MMTLKTILVFLFSIALIPISFSPASAQARLCPQGYYFVEFKDEDQGDRIVRHPVCRKLTYAGNGLVGGTTWIVGYNVPPGARPEFKEKAKKLLLEQARAAGIPYNEKVDFDKYNFVIGIAYSTSFLLDLSNRVIFDEFNNGQRSAQEQTLYNSLKGRQFDTLGCHSNGAMVCLAALENEAIGAKEVVLYGPQITIESLKLWEGLIRKGRVRTVKIKLNENDPVPPISILGGLLNDTPASLVRISLLPLLFNSRATETVINEFAPTLRVERGPCPHSFPSMDCHGMELYTENE